MHGPGGGHGKLKVGIPTHPVCFACNGAEAPLGKLPSCRSAAQRVVLLRRPRAVSARPTCRLQLLPRRPIARHLGQVAEREAVPLGCSLKGGTRLLGRSVCARRERQDGSVV